MQPLPRLLPQQQRNHIWSPPLKAICPLPAAELCGHSRASPVQWELRGISSKRTSSHADAVQGAAIFLIASHSRLCPGTDMSEPTGCPFTHTHTHLPLFNSNHESLENPLKACRLISFYIPFLDFFFHDIINFYPTVF